MKLFELGQFIHNFWHDLFYQYKHCLLYIESAESSLYICKLMTLVFVFLTTLWKPSAIGRQNCCERKQNTWCLLISYYVIGLKKLESELSYCITNLEKEIARQ